MDETKYLNDRMVRLAPQDSVLFLFNMASGYNYSLQDASVGKPLTVDAAGKTDILVTGKNYKGLSGVGPVIGTAKLTYIRRNIAHLQLPVNGSFFNVFSGEPHFLGAITEFKRLTGFNCSTEDFVEDAFQPDANGNRWLKAQPLSLRFVGEVNLGRPQLDNISVAIPGNISASLESYNGIFWAVANRFRADPIITDRPADYNRVSVGTVLNRITDTLVTYLTSFLRSKGIDAAFFPNRVERVNLFNAKVVYKGPLRQGDLAPIPGIDRVIALELYRFPGQWLGGELKLWYSSKGVRTVSFTASEFTPLNMTTPKLLPAQWRSLFATATIGQHLSRLGTLRDLTDAFEWATGHPYLADVFGDLKVTYNGPHRPIDQVPVDSVSCRVIEFELGADSGVAISGPLKFYYKVN